MTTENQPSMHTPSEARSPEDFARQRMHDTNKRFSDIDASLENLKSRLEDVANMTGEIGSEVVAPDKSRSNLFVRTVFALDSLVRQAAPYLRAGAAVVGIGGAAYGTVRGVQAGYRWATKPKADAKALPVGSPTPVTSAD